jgi:hypothetical protein
MTEKKKPEFYTFNTILDTVGGTPAVLNFVRQIATLHLGFQGINRRKILKSRGDVLQLFFSGHDPSNHVTL